MKNGMDDYKVAAYGHVDRGVGRLVWGILGVMSTIIMAEFGWFGSKFVELSNQVSALDAKVTILLTEKFGEKKP